MNKKKWRKLISIAMSLITVVSLCLNMTNSFAVEDNLNTQADGEIYTWEQSLEVQEIIQCLQQKMLLTMNIKMILKK